jgi:hypothetical protein
MEQIACAEPMVWIYDSSAIFDPVDYCLGLMNAAALALMPRYLLSLKQCNALEVQSGEDEAESDAVVLVYP